MTRLEDGGSDRRFKEFSKHPQQSEVSSVSWVSLSTFWPLKLDLSKDLKMPTIPHESLASSLEFQWAVLMSLLFSGQTCISYLELAI